MTVLSARIRHANRAFVQWRTEMKRVHRKALHQSQRISGGASRPKARLAQVSNALAELYELVEKYAPPFYKKSYHDHAASALRLVGKRT
jgi:hypothetical protein